MASISKKFAIKHRYFWECGRVHVLCTKWLCFAVVMVLKKEIFLNHWWHFQTLSEADVANAYLSVFLLHCSQDGLYN